MNIQVTKGQATRKHLGLVNDADNSAIPCTFNGVTASTSDAGICTVSNPAQYTYDFNGINAGSCVVTINASCAYTDPVTNQPVSALKTVVVNVTVVEPANTSMILL